MSDAIDVMAPYVEGPDRYVRLAEDVFGLELAETQKRLLRALAEYQYVLIVSGNGVGKSYGVASGALGFLIANYPSLVMPTSGSYSMLTDTTMKPISKLHRRARERFGVPGRYLQNPPRVAIEDEWYMKAVSPSNPDDLEGRHAEHMLVVVEEADKPSITEDTIDSAQSSLTDHRDRMVVIANPPKDESNIVCDMMDSERWHVIQFGSDESRNVLNDMGRTSKPKIPGLVDLETVVADYEDWNNEPWPSAVERWREDPPASSLFREEYGEDVPAEWPGVETLRKDDGSGIPEWSLDYLRPGFDEAFATDEDGDPVREDLSVQWYRRRMGVMPPSGASGPKPYIVADVQKAEERYQRLADEGGLSASRMRSGQESKVITRAAGIDVARGGGDRNVIVEDHDDVVRVTSEKSGLGGPSENYNEILDTLDSKSVLGPVAIDAVGEGSGVADRVIDNRPAWDVFRFQASEGAFEPTKWRDIRTEAFHHLGKCLRESWAIEPGSDLSKELKAVSRHLEYEEKPLKKGTVMKATKKAKLKDEYGRSPDLLDGAALCAFAKRALGEEGTGGLTF